MRYTSHGLVPRLVIGPAVGLLVWFLVTVAVAQEPLSVSFTIPVADTCGFKRVAESFVAMSECLDLSGPGPVVWEAERPDEFLWQEDGGVRADPEAGCTYASGYTLLRFYYSCSAEQPLNAVLWGRIRHDKQASAHLMGHQWMSEREFRDAGLDPEAEMKRVAGKWRWARLQGLRIQPGSHYLQIVWAWPGAPEVDKFVLVFGAESPEQVEAEPRRTALREYWLESEEVSLPAAQRLQSVKVVARSASGTLEASIDGGKTWQPPQGLALNGAFRLRLRVPAEAAAGINLQGFSATVAADPEHLLVADNGKVRLLVDAVNGGVFRLENIDLQQTLAAPPVAIPLFSLELKKRGEPWPEPCYLLRPQDGRLVAASAQVAGALPSVTLAYDLLEGKIRATVTIALGPGEESLWSLEVDNRSEWDLLTYNFPRLAGLRVGWSGYDDRWLNTNRYGPWMAGAQPEDRPYPGWGALGFADLYDEAAGLSIATREPTEGGTSFLLRPTLARFSDSCSLEARKEHCVPAGEKRTWTYAVLLHPGDWHAAADAYGEWFRSRYGVADHFPEWARDDNGWLQTSCALRDQRFKWPQLLDLFEEARRMGLNHLQIWGQFGSNTCSAFWWPSPKYGPIEEFAAVNRQIREAGGHIGYYLMYCLENRYNQLDTETFEGYLPRSAYPPGVPVLGKDKLISGCLVDDPTGKVTAWPATEQEMKEFRDNLARLLAEGKPYTWARSETWPKESMVRMNPLDKDWQNWLVLWTVGLYTKQWHCDSPYQDVLGAGNAPRSFDLRRGDHGQIYDGERQIAERLVREGKAADPDFALVAEGKQEQVTRWALGMTSSSHYGWIDLAAHRYTHPDHILYMGAANGGYTQLVKNCELAYLYGARFDLIMTGDIRALRRIVTFREDFKRYQFRARYRDTVGLKIEGEGLRATRHDRLDGGARSILVTVVNDRQVSDGRLQVDTEALGTDRYGAFWLTDDWQPYRAAVTLGADGWASTPVPANRWSALLLVARAAPAEDLLAGVRPAPVVNGYTTRVWLCNLTPQRRQLSLTLEGPSQGTALEVDLEPFGVFAKTVDCTVPAGVQPAGYVRLRSGERVLAAGFVYAPVEDPSFEKDGAPVPDAAEGTKVARLGPVQGWQGVMRLLNLEPAHRYRITVSARRSGDKGNMYGLVRIRNTAGQWRYTRLDFPPGVFGEWVRLEGEFETPADLTEADVYLYNMDSEVTVDYDDLKVEMVT